MHDDRPFDAINPKHYRSHPSRIQTIEIAEHLGYLLGNCFKYVARSGLKGPAVEDLCKAAWFSERLLKSDFHAVDVGHPRKSLVFWAKVQDWITAEPDSHKRTVLSHIATVVNARRLNAREFDAAARRLHTSIIDVINAISVAEVSK